MKLKMIKTMLEEIGYTVREFEMNDVIDIIDCSTTGMLVLDCNGIITMDRHYREIPYFDGDGKKLGEFDGEEERYLKAPSGWVWSFSDMTGTASLKTEYIIFDPCKYSEAAEEMRNRLNDPMKWNSFSDAIKAKLVNNLFVWVSENVIHMNLKYNELFKVNRNTPEYINEMEKYETFIKKCNELYPSLNKERCD